MILKTAYNMKPPPGARIITRPSSLVGCWLMNEGGGQKVLDSSGNNYDGTVHTDTIWRAAKFGTGLDFDGVNDGRVEILAMAKMNKNTFTLSMWLYNRSDGESNAGHLWMWDGHTKFEMAADTRLRFYVDFTTTDGQWLGDAGVVPLNQWIMLTVVYDGSSVDNNPVIYRNGIDISALFPKATSPVGTFVQPSTKAFWIGTNYNSAVREADCIIDNLLIFNRTLTTSEITQLCYDPWWWWRRRAKPELAYVSAAPPTVKPWWYYQRAAMRRAC